MAFTREQFFGPSFLRHRERVREKEGAQATKEGSQATSATSKRRMPPNIIDKAKRVFWRTDDDLAHEADVYAAKEKARRSAELEFAPRQARYEVESRYKRKRLNTKNAISGFSSVVNLLGQGGRNFAANMGGMYTGMYGNAPKRRSRRRRKVRYRWVRERV
jgi:hypothetical protein